MIDTRESHAVVFHQTTWPSVQSCPSPCTQHEVNKVELNLSRPVCLKTEEQNTINISISVLSVSVELGSVQRVVSQSEDVTLLALSPSLSISHPTGPSHPGMPKCSTSIESVQVLSNPFPSKPLFVFSPQKPFYSQPNYMYIPLGDQVFFGAFFRAIQLIKSPDVNKNKGVAEMIPLTNPLTYTS